MKIGCNCKEEMLKWCYLLLNKLIQQEYLAKQWEHFFSRKAKQHSTPIGNSRMAQVNPILE